MRRHSLPPPRPLALTALGEALPGSFSGGQILPAHVPTDAATNDPPTRDRLSPPSLPRERRRRLFHPERGWIRRLERRLSVYLSAQVYPRVPGLRLPYERQLRRLLTLSEADVELDGLPRPFDGRRLLLITDPHAGPFVRPAALERTFERLLALEPDLILLGGDLTTARLGEFTDNSAAFRRLRAPLGVFAVLGNHDYYGGQARRLRGLLERCGITVLHNRAVEVEYGGRSLSIAGVDDLLMGRPDLEAALDGTARPVVLLCHNPDLFFDAARRGVTLMLSGHTHAGQIRLPGLPVLVRQSRYRLDEGRYRAGATELVVSRGLGAVGLPWRLACTPEAVMLTLRRKRGESPAPAGDSAAQH